MLSAFMAFIEPGDEVIIFEPFFDQSVLLLCDFHAHGQKNILLIRVAF